MALQVWLPLNGDLKNKGCANVTVTNNGATVDNNGKIGKCYKFTADNNNIKINNFMPILKNYNNYSLCAWIYMTSAATNHSTTILSSGNWNNTNANFVFALYNYSSGYTKLLVPNTRSWNTVSINLSDKLVINTWYHIVVTYDGTTTTAYVNGEIIGSASSGGICENSDSDNVRIGGATYYDGFTLKGNINDVRIYDHCLSAAEVKEISRGLVLHYKLDDPVVSLKFYDYIQSDGNSYIDTGVNPKIKPRVIANLAMLNDADKDYWGNSAINGSAYYANFYTRNLRYYRYGSTTARNVNYTVDLNTWHTWDVSKEVYVDGNLKYTSPDTYTYNSSQASIQIFKAARSTYYSAYKLKYFKLYDGDALVRDFVPCECNGIPGLWDWVENKFYSNLGSGTLTLGTEINSNTTIIDSSGYNNHGTITGNLTSSNETSRYNSSVLFNGINSCITIPYKQINPSGIFTMNLWFKKDSLGTKNYETLFGGPSGFEMDTRANNASTLSLYMASTRGGNVFSPFNFGEWYMVTMVRDGTNEFYYINGELKKTIGAKSMPNGTYFIGAWKTSTQQNYCGYISDFRLYCTTLSAEDIKQLYEVSAKIDNLGNFHTYEFVENENNKPTIFKTGEVEINEFIEKYDYLYLPAGTRVSTGLDYAAGDSCKAETTIRYGTNGSGRDLMGYSASGGGYWGVKANGTWEPHGTFTYTNADITVKNDISYIFSSATEHGIYVIGALANSYSVRDKYIYRVKLYKNGLLERDMYPARKGSSVGLFDMINNIFYTTNNSNATLGSDDEQYITKLFKTSIKSNQFIEI